MFGFLDPLGQGAAKMGPQIEVCKWESPRIRDSNAEPRTRGFLLQGHPRNCQMGAVKPEEGPLLLSSQELGVLDCGMKARKSLSVGERTPTYRQFTSSKLPAYKSLRRFRRMSVFNPSFAACCTVEPGSPRPFILRDHASMSFPEASAIVIFRDYSFGSPNPCVYTNTSSLYLTC